MSKVHTSQMPQSGASNTDHDPRYMPRGELARVLQSMEEECKRYALLVGDC